MLNRYYKNYGIMRGVALTASSLLLLGSAVKSHCYTMEMDYRGPGSEMEASERQYRDRENSEAADRCREARERGERPSREDSRRESEYERDHAA